MTEAEGRGHSSDVTRCTVAEGFDEACQQPARYVAHWTDNDDRGYLCDKHAAVARALPNGPSLHLQTLRDGDSGA